MIKKLVTLALGVGATLNATACKTREPESAGVMAAGSSVSQARRVLAITGKGTGDGADKGTCASSCHNVNAALLKRWVRNALTAHQKCLVGQTDPAAQFNCLDGENIGLLRAGVHTAAMRNIYAAAGKNEAEINDFIGQQVMPAENNDGIERMTDEQFDLVRNWVVAGGPGLDQVFGPTPTTGGATPLSECTDQEDASLKAYLKTRNEDYWARRLVQQPAFESFACPPTFKANFANDPIGAAKSCFASYENVTQWVNTAPATGDNWVTLDGVKTVTLKELPYKSFYWMRSSVDGRFIGNGFQGMRAGNEAMKPACADSSMKAVVEDLKPSAAGGRQRVFVNGQYDPGFYANNAGFSFHGIKVPNSDDVNLAMCNMKLLTTPPFSQCVNLTASAAGRRYCMIASGVNVYQHIGNSLDGDDTYVVRGTYENDNGAFDRTEDAPTAKFARSNANVDIYKYGTSGERLVDAGHWNVTKPYNGDWIISPSSKLLVSRVSGPQSVAPDKSVMQGYNIQALSFDGGKPKLTDVGRVCLRGDKPGLSSNERIIATHHYVAADDKADLGLESLSDEAFKDQYVSKSSNLYIQDLCTGRKSRVTNMGPGQFALFPHFRADGWLYFMVRDMNQNKDYAMATDAGLRMQEQGSCGG